MGETKEIIRRIPDLEESKNLQELSTRLYCLMVLLEWEDDDPLGFFFVPTSQVWLRSCGMASFYISFDVNISRDLHEPALVIGGCFVLVALILSLLLIFQHLRYYTSLVG